MAHMRGYYHRLRYQQQARRRPVAAAAAQRTLQGENVKRHAPRARSQQVREVLRQQRQVHACREERCVLAAAPCATERRGADATWLLVTRAVRAVRM